MKYETAGESHGPALIALVSDVPVGFSLSSAAINSDLARRQSGYGRGGRMAIEHDEAQILSGVRFGKTLGTPIALKIDNRDWENWSVRMAQEGKPPHDLTLEQSPRPGHADLAGVLKIDSQDCRDILERASARETAARVAAGAVAKAYLAHFGVELGSYVTRIGDVELPAAKVERKGAVFAQAEVEASPVRCPDEATSARMTAAIDEARAAGESLGGWFNVTATGMPPGIGSYAEADKRLTSRIGGALFSIPAIKGVEFGLGFAAGALPGSQVHDPLIYAEAAGAFGHIVRASNNAGGLEGGMTT
ncbi:MAG: chorismate synthase, partial [Coriobacteriales bacterium]|nr:chorismate synthase [Coriobacteriales bacterium]